MGGFGWGQYMEKLFLFLLPKHKNTSGLDIAFQIVVSLSCDQVSHIHVVIIWVYVNRNVVCLCVYV